MTQEQDIFEGPIMVRGKGTGFVSVDGHDEDIVIEREALGFALDGDIVKIALLPQKPGERRQGKVLEVVEPKPRELIGVIRTKVVDGKTVYYFSPDNHRLHIRPIVPDATETDLEKKVVVAIVSWKQALDDPIAEITDILGPVGDHETEMQAIMRAGGFAHHFPDTVQKAAEELHERSDEIFTDALADEGRRDVRDVTTFTIDPHDAKDFDDALSIQTLENGNYEVGIHIADVSHYVREGDVIDHEARERGTSVYLVDRVIPMLPEVLSNDLCSLRPNVDRLAFSAIFEMDSAGTVVAEWYGQTVIHSDHRFSYEDAQHVLEQGDGPYHTELASLMKLSRHLRHTRHQAGAIAFEQPEVQFELDESGKPIDVFVKERVETMLMIEDFMLLANQHVAHYVYKLCKKNDRNAAFVYRVHDEPNPDKIEELATFVHALGYEFETNHGVVKATDINQLLAEVTGKPEEDLIKTATIRSMAKAVYTTKNIGHFGLAFRYYTHFTSPIRRYPDLMVHRLLRKHLDGTSIDSKELAKYERLAVQSSDREAQAVKAERDSIKYKQVEYMLDKVGQEFDAIISGVADWGIYVEEKASHAEGMIRLAAIEGDYWVHDSSKYHVKGDRTGKKFRLGDDVRVKLTRADLEDRQLDFELVEKK